MKITAKNVRGKRNHHVRVSAKKWMIEHRPGELHLAVRWPWSKHRVTHHRFESTKGTLARFQRQWGTETSWRAHERQQELDAAKAKELEERLAERTDQQDGSDQQEDE